MTAFADDPVKNALVQKVYAGDLKGNIWRFDTETNVVTKLGIAKDAGGTEQPITTVIPTREVNGKVQVMVGTGRLLGNSDILDAQTQSIFSIVDGGTGGHSDLRAALTPITLSLTGSGASRAVTSVCNATAAQCEAPLGWYIDLPSSGERIVTDMKFASGTLVAATSLLDSNACNAGGTTQIYQFNAFTGLDPSLPRSAPPGTTSNVSTGQIAGLPVGVTIRQLLGGGLSAQVTTVQGEVPGGTLKKVLPPKGTRITWREVIQ